MNIETGHIRRMLSSSLSLLSTGVLIIP